MSSSPENTTEQHNEPETSGQATDLTPQKPEGEALREAIKKQVDYYFSKENLANDRYLVSQMNAEAYVPIKVITNFKMIKSLTTDFDLVVSVMRECKSVVVDESGTLVKPNLKAQRNTLILRDISSQTPVEEIKAIFDVNQCGQVSEIRGDIGDYWYVTFEDEDGALKALEFVREKSFKDQPIKARIKTENTFRSFLPGLTTPTPTTPAAPAPYAYYPGYTYPPQGATPQNWNGRQSGYVYENGDGSYQRNNYEGGGRRGGYRSSSGGRANRREYSGNNGGGSGSGGRGRNQRNNSNRSGGESNERREGSGRKRRGSEGGVNVPQLGPANFPPLPSMHQTASGYADEFKQFSKQDILDIIKGMKDVTKPENLLNDPKVVALKPCFELEITKPYPKKTTAADIAKKTPEQQHHQPQPQSPQPQPQLQPVQTQQTQSQPSQPQATKKPIETVWQPTSPTSPQTQHSHSPTVTSPPPTVNSPHSEKSSSQNRVAV